MSDTEPVKDEQALAQAAYDKAYRYETDYGCCPQCVLSAVNETIGGVSEDTIKASHGLSGGGALCGDGVCGALAGGLIALGTRKGRSQIHCGRGMGNFTAGNRLIERFRSEFGGLTCRELQQQFTGRSYDLWRREDYAAFGAARGDKCSQASGAVAQWVVEMLGK